MTISRHTKITQQVVKNKHEILLTTVISWETEYFRKKHYENISQSWDSLQLSAFYNLQ